MVVFASPLPLSPQLIERYNTMVYKFTQLALYVCVKPTATKSFGAIRALVCFVCSVYSASGRPVGSSRLFASFCVPANPFSLPLLGDE